MKRTERRLWVALACLAACRAPSPGALPGEVSPAGEPAAPSAPAEPVAQPPSAPAEPDPRVAAAPAPSARRVAGVAVSVWHVAAWSDGRTWLWPGAPPNVVRQGGGALALDPARGDFGPPARAALARVEAELELERAGEAELRLRGGPGTRVYVDGVLALRGAAAQERLALDAGSHALVVEHDASRGAPALELDARLPGRKDFEPLAPLVPLGELPQAKPQGLRRTVELPPAPERAASALAGPLHPAFALEDALGAARTQGLPATAALAGGGSELLVASRNALWRLDPAGSAVERPFAAGLDGVRGVAQVAGRVFVLQRSELTELSDGDGDGRADEYRAAWNVPASGGADELESVALCEWNGALVLALAPRASEGAPAPRGELVRFDPRSGEARALASCARRVDALGAFGEWLVAARGRELAVFDADGRELGSAQAPPRTSEGPAAGLGAPVRLASGPFEGQWLAADLADGALLRFAFQTCADGRVQGSVARVADSRAGTLRAERARAGAAGEVLLQGAGGGASAARTTVQRLNLRESGSFELHSVGVGSGDVVLEFSGPLEVGAGWEPGDYRITRFDGADVAFAAPGTVRIAGDRRRVALAVGGLASGALLRVELGLGVTGERGERPWTREAWLTVHALDCGSDAWDELAAKPGPDELARRASEAGWSALFPAPGPGLLGWSVRDGELHAESGALSAVSEAEFDDFELEFEWRVPRGGAAVVLYRGGVGLSLLDDEGHIDGRNPLRVSGAAWDREPPRVRAARAVGEWNRARVVVRGRDVVHELNGEAVLSLRLPEGVAPREALELAVRGHGASFRGLRVRQVRS